MARILTPRENRPVRLGFTLIELLVVVAIAVLIMGLSVGAWFRVVAAQATANTRTVISRTNSRLKQQMAYVADQARNAPYPGSVLQLAGNNPDRAQVIWMKLMFKQWFPQTFNEALNPAQGYLNGLAGYQAYLGQYGITGSSAGSASYESGACLYMILRHGQETTGDDDLGLAANTKYFNGVPVLVDGNGNPLVFCRWPTGDSSGVSPANPSGPQPGFNDPFDPKGTLTAASWQGQASLVSNFGKLCHPVLPRSSPVTTLNLTPVILSAGPDGQLGLNPRTLMISVTNPTQANDNIYSSNLP